MKKKHEPIVFIDFDNTITKYDILDDIILKFSINDRWMELEKKWKAGRIGSRDCLKGQVAGIRVTKNRLNAYLDTVKLDPYFKKLVKLFKENKVKMMILSDDFDLVINRVLEKNKVTGIEVRSNKLKIVKDKVIPSFPFTGRHCGRCGHCKHKNLLANVDKETHLIYYIGDGLSDICPSKIADIVFAKGSLIKYCRKDKIDCMPINNLRDVYKYFKRSFK